MEIIIFVIAFILSFMVSSHFSGHHEGHKKEKGLLFHTKNGYEIHIHHYVWTGGLMVFTFFVVYNYVIIGILSGATFQGLTYRDRFIFFYKTEDFEKIYQRFNKPHWGIHIRFHARKLNKAKINLLDN